MSKLRRKKMEIRKQLSEQPAASPSSKIMSFEEFQKKIENGGFRYRFFDEDDVDYINTILKDKNWTDVEVEITSEWMQDTGDYYYLTLCAMRPETDAELRRRQINADSAEVKNRKTDEKALKEIKKRNPDLLKTTAGRGADKGDPEYGRRWMREES